jgi:hypothetical protein
MDEPVKITVRGIDFFIFPNGEFDFNAHQRRNRHYYSSNGYGIRIDRDRYGKIRRIGNVFINYNRHRQVSRIGRVFIKYNRRGLVVKIGNKRLKYAGRRYAVIRHRPHYGFIAGFYYGPSSSYIPEYTYSDYDYSPSWDDEWNDDYSGDSDYYYRPKKGKAKTKIKGRRK